MASIRKRGDTYEYRIRYKDSTGKYREKSKNGFKSEKEARFAALKVEEQIYGGIDINSGEVLLPVYLGEFLESKKGQIAPRTYLTYERNLRLHISPYFANTRIKNLNRINYKQFIGKLLETYTAGTVAIVHSFFHEAIDNAVNELNILNRNPIAKIKISKPEKRKGTDEKCWEAEELNRFLTATLDYTNGYSYNILFTFLSRTGLRIGEALALTWADIDLDSKTVDVHKTLHSTNRYKPIKFGPPKNKSSNRKIGIDSDTIAMLLKWKSKQSENILRFGRRYQDLDFVFTNEMNNVLFNSTAHQFMKKICSKHDIRFITVHGLRHTHAVHLLQSGADIKSVSARLGHSSINMTANVYLHILKSMEAKTIDNYEQFLKSCGQIVGE